MNFPNVANAWSRNVDLTVNLEPIDYLVLTDAFAEVLVPAESPMNRDEYRRAVDSLIGMDAKEARTAMKGIFEVRCAGKVPSFSEDVPYTGDKEQFPRGKPGMIMPSDVVDPFVDVVEVPGGIEGEEYQLLRDTVGGENVSLSNRAMLEDLQEEVVEVLGGLESRKDGVLRQLEEVLPSIIEAEQEQTGPITTLPSEGSDFTSDAMEEWLGRDKK